MAIKESFFLGDRPTLIFEARQPDPYRFEDPDGIPAHPIDVEYIVWDRTEAEIFSSEGQTVFGVNDGLIELEPADEGEDRGTLIRLRFPLELTTSAGAYTLYLTTIFADGVRITDDYRVDYLEYR